MAWKDSKTIEEWCLLRRISRRQFYNLIKAGKAPRTIKIAPQTVRITADADREWLAAREAESAAVAA